LEKALALKTFDGKEKVLDAFVKFTKAARTLWENEPSIAIQMKKIAIREAKRNNDAYRPHAFTSLGEYSEARTDIDMFDEVYNVIASMLEDLTNEDKMDTTDDTKSSGTSNEAATITAGISALFRAVNTKRLDPSPLIHLPRLLDVVKAVLLSTKVTVATRLTLYERTKVLFDGLSKGKHAQDSSRYELALGFFTLLELPSGSGSEMMRTKRGEAAETIVQAFAGGIFGLSSDGRDACKESMREMVVEGGKHERSPGVKATFERVIRVLQE
jgi:proteasome component ECM29